MKIIIISCFGDRICGTFLGLSDEDNSVSQTDNFVNVFNSVTSPPVLSCHCVLHNFLTVVVVPHTKVNGFPKVKNTMVNSPRDLRFHFNLTFGLRLQVGGIKIVRLSVYKRSIFQVFHFNYLACALMHDLACANVPKGARSRNFRQFQH